MMDVHVQFNSLVCKPPDVLLQLVMGHPLLPAECLQQEP